MTQTNLGKAAVRFALLLASTVFLSSGPIEATNATFNAAYLNDIRLIYSHLSPGIAADPSPSLLRARDRIFIGLSTRLVSPPSMYGRSSREYKQATHNLAEAQQRSSENSIAVIAPLVDLASVSREDPTEMLSLINRAVGIAEDVPLRERTSPDAVGAAAALATLGGEIAGGNHLDMHLRERILRAAYKLQIESSGITRASLDTLGDLCLVLSRNGKTAEALALYDATMDQLNKDHAPMAAENSIRFRQRYADFLKQNHMPEQAAAVEKTLVFSHKEKTTAAQAQADDRLARAKERAEVDPVGVDEALVHAANMHFQNDDRIGAKKLFADAVAGYRKISPHETPYQLEDAMRNFINGWLREARTKQEETIIYPYIDAIVERASGGAKGRGLDDVVPEIVQHFTFLHRGDDAIAFLEHLWQSLLQQKHQKVSDLTLVANLVVPLYTQVEQPSKAEQVKEQLISIAESTPDADEKLVRLLRSSQFCVRQKYFQDESRLLSEAMVMIEKAGFVATPQLAAISELTLQLEDNNRLDDAEKAIRAAYTMAEKCGAPARNELAPLDIAETQLVSKLQQAGQLDRAGSLLEFISEKNLNASGLGVSSLGRNNSPTLTEQMSDLCLRNAAAERDAGKSAESRRLRKQSDALFQKVLDSYARNQYMLENENKHRQSLLRQLGFENALDTHR